MMQVTPHYSSREVLQFTYDCTKRLLTDNIPGVFVECGVASGSQIGAMQNAMQDLNIDQKIYAFDSFEGIPYAGQHDAEQPGIGAKDKSKEGVLESSGVSSHSIDAVMQNFKRWKLKTDNLIFVKGWFENTVPDYKIGKIALLRLDGDLYSSTKVCLEHLLSKVSKGGLVIIDDYQLAGCRKAVHEHIAEDKIIKHLGIAYYEVPK